MFGNLTSLLPLVSQLGNYLKLGIDHYADLRTAGKEAGPEIVAIFLNEKMKGWSPKVGDIELLDEITRASGARFLAGVAVNFATAGAK